MINLDLLKSLVQDALAKETAETLDEFLRDYSDYTPFSERNLDAFTGKASTKLMQALRGSFAPTIQLHEQKYDTNSTSMLLSSQSYNMAA